MFEVGEVLAARGNVKAKRLRPGGTLYARITSSPAGASTAAAGGALTLQAAFRGHQLKGERGLFSRGDCDPFFEVSAKVVSAGGGMTWQPVYRSKHVDNSPDPQWESFEVDLSRLCQCDYEKPILIKVFDWRRNGRHIAIGSCETNVNAILAQSQASGSGFVLKKLAHQINGFLIVTSALIVGGGGGSLSSNGTPTPSSFASSLPSPVAPPKAPPGGSTGGAHHKVSASSPSVYAAPPTSDAWMSSSATGPLPPPISPPTLMSSAPAVMPATTLEAPAMTTPQPASSVPPRTEKPTFVDYLSGGLELELSIAIDFTGSNGGTSRQFRQCHQIMATSVLYRR